MNQDSLADTKSLNGIRGWLLILFIVLSVSSFQLVYGLVTNWRLYYPAFIRLGQAKIVALETLGNSIAISICLLSLFFVLRKRVLAIKFIIFGYCVYIPFYTWFDYYLWNYGVHNFVSRGSLTPAQGMSIVQNPTFVARSFLIAFIWVMYLTKSKRIKATLIEPQKQVLAITEINPA